MRDLLLFDIFTINVSSCKSNFHSIAGYVSPFGEVAQSTILCAQETRIHPLKAKRLSRDLEKQGWDTTIGVQPPVKKNATPSRGTVWRQPNGGVATFSTPQCSVAPVQIPSDFNIDQHVQALFVSQGQSGMYLVNCYLPSGNSSEVRRLRNALMDRVFNFVATLPHAPVFILGDFQDPPGANATVSAALCTGEWVDLIDSFCFAVTKPIPDTFVRVSGDRVLRSRIDYILANSAACRLVADCVCDEAAGFPDHRPVGARIVFPDHPQKAFVLKRDPVWKFDGKPRQWASRDEFVSHILLPHMQGLCLDASQQNVEGLWSKACAAVTDILNHFATDSISQPKGDIPQFVEADTVGCSKTSHIRSRRIAKSRALFKEIEIKIRRPGFDENREQQALFNSTVQNLRRCLALLNVDSSQFRFNSAEEISDSFRAFSSQIKRQDWEKANVSIKRWKRKLQISNRADRKMIHRWIKGGYSGPPKIMKNGDTFTGSIPVMLETVSNKMRQIYNFHAGANPQVMLDQFLQKYQGPIQAANCQADVPALKPEHSGLDQWRYKDLQQLPVQGWVPFYLVAMLAEATGEWPRAMTCISVSCIPKDDSPVLNPDAIRAIGVSSAVYGLWSSIRFGHLGDWMNSVAPATLLGGLPGRSAELSEIEFSHAVQEPNEAERVVAIFIDRFKCFDMVLPHVGLGVAKAVGLPGTIFKGISGFYANQVKFFKIGSFYGKEVLSCNAVIQGCSMSVMMVNVLYSILVRSLQQVVLNPPPFPLPLLLMIVKFGVLRIPPVT